ncbi:MAG: SDR family oxidoreductase, partial [Bacteroidota bacterium]
MIHKGCQNKVAVITGAASGLGLAITKRLALEHARLALIDKNSNALANVQSQLTCENEIYPVDITTEKDVHNTIDKIATHFGTIDILINSAGITGKTNIKSHLTETENLRSVFDVNFMGSFFTSKYALPVMIKNNYGRILHIASIAGKEGNAGMIAYSASKAAVIAMTKVQGKEYA